MRVRQLCKRIGIFEKRLQRAPVASSPCKAIARRSLSAIQEEEPPQKPTHFDPAFWTTGKYLKKKCLSYPVHNTRQLKLQTQIFLLRVGYSVITNQTHAWGVGGRGQKNFEVCFRRSFNRERNSDRNEAIDDHRVSMKEEKGGPGEKVSFCKMTWTISHVNRNRYHRPFWWHVWGKQGEEDIEN